MLASLLLCHVSCSVSLVVWGWGCFGFFSSYSLIALALEKRSLFHSRSCHDLPLLSHSMQCLSYPFSLFLYAYVRRQKKKEQLRSYCLLIILFCWRRFLQGRQWFSIFLYPNPGRAFCASLPEPVSCSVCHTTFTHLKWCQVISQAPRLTSQSKMHKPGQNTSLVLQK